MVGSLAELATLLGLGGVFGILTGLALAGKRFADHLSHLAATIETVLKDPRRADLAALADEARLVEQDAKTVLGMLKQVFRS